MLSCCIFSYQGIALKLHFYKMAHSLMSPPPPAASPKPISGIDVKQASLQFQQRRSFFYGLIGVGLGSTASSSDIASAAKRKPPPPPTEKKDPNVSGVQAKVLAGKKRKEEFKEEVARLREKGRQAS